MDLVTLEIGVAAAVAVSQVYERLIPGLTDRILQSAAHLRHQGDQNRADVLREEWSAVMEETPGKLRHLALAIAFLGWAASNTLSKLWTRREPSSAATSLMRRRLRMTWFTISSAVILGLMAVTINVATSLRNNASWWGISAILFALLFFNLLVTKFKPTPISLDPLLAKLSAQREQYLRTPQGPSSASIKIPFRISIRTDQARVSPGLHESYREIYNLVEQDQQARIAIVGDNGAGKTTLLYEIARQALEQASSGENPQIPILLHAADWHLSNSLTQWLTGEIARRFLVKETTAYRLVLQGALLLLLDGLDEVPADSRSKIADLLVDGLDGCRALSAVVACRTSEFQPLAERLKDFTVIAVEPLTIPDIRDCLRTLPPDINRTAIELQLESEPALLEAAKNPLLLRLLVNALSLKDPGPSAISDPTWSALAIGGDLAKRGNTEDALRVYEAAAASSGRSLSTSLAGVLTGQMLARLGRHEDADVAFEQAKSTYGRLLEDLAISSRSGFEINQDQQKILRSLRIGVTYDEGQVAGITMLPPGAVQHALSSLREIGLVSAHEGETGRRWQLTEAAVLERAAL
jgi:hypothetical protein